MAALKFADLSNFRGTSYVFDLDRFSSFEGKTGPYLLYQAVRIKSLLRKAGEEGAEPGPIAIAEPAERDLALRSTPSTMPLGEAYDKKAPNFIAEHAYRLAQAFSKLLPGLPGPQRADAAARGSRLALAAVDPGPAGDWRWTCSASRRPSGCRRWQELGAGSIADRSSRSPP